MYTDSQTLVASWLSLENMKLLFSAVADGDFGVEADAIQTLQVSCLSIVMFNTTILMNLYLQNLFSSKRKNDETFKDFLSEHLEEILNLFTELYNSVNYEGDFDEEASDAAENTNVWALRECMKLEYQMLQDYSFLRNHFSNSVDRLKQTLKLLNNSDTSIEQEAILHLSVFVLVPNRDPKIVNILSKNKAILIEFMSNYRPHHMEQDFEALLEILQEKLNQL